MTSERRHELEHFLHAHPWARARVLEALDYCRTRYASTERVYAPEEVCVVECVIGKGVGDIGRYDDSEAAITIQRGRRWHSTFGIGPGGAYLWSD